MTVTQIREALAYLAACLREIHEGAVTRGATLTDVAERNAAEALTADEQTRWDAGSAEITRLEGLLARAVQVERISALAPANVTPGFSGAPEVIVKRDAFDLSDLRFDATPQEIRSRGLRAIEQVEGLGDAHREQAERLVRTLDPTVAIRIAATGSDTYRDAFSKYAAGQRDAFTPDEAAAWSRAASLTDNAGGYAVPFTLDPTVILTSDGSTNPFRQISRVVPVTTDTWNGVSSAGVTAAFAAEAAAVSDGAPTLAQPSVTVHKAHASVDYSIEIGQDWAQFGSEMLRLFADAKDNLEATKFAVGVGDGSNEPYGIVTALAGTSSEINVSTSEALVVADIYAVENALGDRYRQNAKWVANKAIYNLIRQFDTAGGASLWERLGAGLPSELIGYPVYESSAMDGAYSAAATANNYIMVLGDFQNYLIADRVGLSVEYVPHRVNGDGALTGQRGLYAFWRVGADSINDSAFTLLDLPTTA